MRALVKEGRRTLNAVVDACCEKFHCQPSLGMAMEKAISYEELHEYVVALAKRLQDIGINKGDRLAILAENSPGWGMAYLATVRLGAVAVPILPEMSQSDVQHILSEMKVKALFTTQKQMKKIAELYNKKKLDAPIFTFDNVRELSNKFGSSTVTPFSEMLESARENFRKMIEKPAFPEVKESDLASIIYTSGTSGFSKAVMLTHGNLTTNAYAASELAEMKPNPVWLSILPLSHAYEFSCGFILPLIFGAKVAYTDKLPTPAILKKLCEYEKPTVIFAVPLILEKIYKKRVLPELEKKWFLRLACKVGVLRRTIYRKVGAKLYDFFGGNLQFMGIGGAKLNPEVEQFFHEARFPYLIGYGMTEGSPLIAGGPLFEPSIAVGSTGKPIPGVQVRIASPSPETGVGEIQVTGPNVMCGYFGDEESTTQTLLDDGWLATGDIGFFDKKGNLHVTGRLKNVIVMPNGENVYPEGIEHKLSSSLWVSEAVVVEHKGQLEGWIYPDYEYLEENHKELSDEKCSNLLEEELNSLRKSLNEDLSKTARLNRIFIKTKPFIKTATTKIKRYLYTGDNLRQQNSWD